MTDTSAQTPDDVLSIGGRYYVRVTAALADENDRVLKHDESFAVVDRQGDILPLGLAEEGIYHNGTRHLSRLVLRIGRERPLLLGSRARSENSRLAVDLTNPDVVRPDGHDVPRSTVHIARSKVLLDGVCYERMVVRNFGEEPIRLPMSIRFGADFRDVFEVRGTQRQLSGRQEDPVVSHGDVTLSYHGADGVRRRTRLTFEPMPDELRPDEAIWELELDPDDPRTIDVSIACETDGREPVPVGYTSAVRAVSQQYASALGDGARVGSTNERFQDLLDRSGADVAMMTTRTEVGPFPYAGVPWFSTPFGRDALITARECLWFAPALAGGVLRFLASTQADEYDAARDAQPGKIVHEMRGGEMAATGEVPFARYYGSHDATPLFMMLLHDTWRRTADLELVRDLWPHALRALDWMRGDADPDGDGFAEYRRATDDGILQQGWKDSDDSISHADGTLARGPIALVEVQAYIHAARVGAASMARAIGENAEAARLDEEAERLRQAFEAAFWVDELGTYALALDGDKRQCQVIASNAGHALFAGIASSDRAVRVADALMHERSFSGWGIRTLAAGERRYNPMSYHNGSIWPHDTAIVAAGLARYGVRDGAARLLDGLCAASLDFDLYRMPELFCGFTRQQGEGPTRYPVACSPQSWAAASVFLLLEAALGLCVDAVERRITVGPGKLPASIERVTIRNLRVGDAEVDVDVSNQGDGLGLDVRRRTASIEVLVVK